MPGDVRMEVRLGPVPRLRDQLNPPFGGPGGVAVMRAYAASDTPTNFADSGLWFVTVIVVADEPPPGRRFTNAGRATPRYPPGIQKFWLGVMPSISARIRTVRSAFVQPAPCWRTSRCMSSAPAFMAVFTWEFVGFAPPCVSRYASTPSAATPAVTGVAWDVPEKMSKAKLPSAHAGSSAPVNGFTARTFNGPASTAKDPMLTMSGFGCPSRVGPRLEKYATSP